RTGEGGGVPVGDRRGGGSWGGRTARSATTSPNVRPLAATARCPPAYPASTVGMLTVIGMSRPPGGNVLGRRLVAAHAARDAERFCGDALLLPGARHRLLHCGRPARARSVSTPKSGTATTRTSDGCTGSGVKASFPAAPRRTRVAPP